MVELFHHQLVVSPQEIDYLGHANNLVYLKWMIDAAVAHSEALGWTSERYQQMGSGWVVRSHQITYLAPVFAGQIVTVRTWIASNRGASCVRRYEIVRAGDEAEQLAARAETLWAYIRFASGMPMRIPDEVAESFPVHERAWNV